jgi:transcriptional regulator with XRE-family HTH domain
MKGILSNISEDEFLKHFSEELAKERKQRKLTQKCILDETGIHIGRIEAMGRSPQLFGYFCICVFLKVPFDRILNKVYESMGDIQ